MGYCLEREKESYSEVWNVNGNKNNVCCYVLSIVFSNDFFFFNCFMGYVLFFLLIGEKRVKRI